MALKYPTWLSRELVWSTLVQILKYENVKRLQSNEKFVDIETKLCLLSGRVFLY